MQTTTKTAISEDDPNDCVISGVPVYRPSKCLPYRLVAKESPVVPNSILSDRLTRAFAAWLTPNAVCAPGISAIELEPIDTTTIVDYRVNGPNANVIGVVTEWKHGPDRLALTTVSFRPDTGEVLDTDLEVNGTVSLSFGEPEANYDLQSILTHEVGHMLGFASGVVPSTECQLTPGTSGGCGEADITHGCATTRSPRPIDTMLLALVAVVAGALVRRRSR